jgi:hypothetical protein
VKDETIVLMSRLPEAAARGLPSDTRELQVSVKPYTWLLPLLSSVPVSEGFKPVTSGLWLSEFVCRPSQLNIFD